jgi:hypothetical protein
MVHKKHKIMKPKIQKFSTLIFLLLLLGGSCQKDEIEHADESIEIGTYPGITVYKTKSNYIDFVDVQITDDGQLNAIPSYDKNDSRIKIDKNGKAAQNFRWRLKSGYILDNNASLREAFTDITIQEYVDWNTANGVAGWPDSLIWPRIIDYDPFLEFYYMESPGQPESYTIGEINDMIENGTFKAIFKKLKQLPPKIQKNEIKKFTITYNWFAPFIYRGRMPGRRMENN